MNRELVLATRNEDKVQEILALLSEINLNVITLSAYPDAPEVIEDGKTLEENAIKKAKVIANYTGKTAVADDTGLEVDYLKGRPGVMSSRYSGANASYSDNVDTLLRDLKGVPRENRTARFRCVVAICNNNEVMIVEGICEGIICEEPRGESGFGYDPLFYVSEFKCTFAEMELSLKNQISHRAKAFQELKMLIERGGWNKINQ